MNSVTGVICKHSHANITITICKYTGMQVFLKHSITMNSETGVICKYMVMQVSLKHSNTMNSETGVICKYMVMQVSLKHRITMKKMTDVTCTVMEVSLKSSTAMKSKHTLLSVNTISNAQHHDEKQHVSSVDVLSGKGPIVLLSWHTQMVGLGVLSPVGLNKFITGAQKFS